MAAYLLAHDLGTSGDKATLFTAEGKIVGNVTVPYPLYAEDKQAEQDADDWWNAVCTGTKALLEKNGVQGDEVLAVSFSGQMMGCLPVDGNGRPLRRALIWADRRADEQSFRLREKLDDDRFYSITCHRNIPSYGIQKAMWIKEHEPDIYENTYKFLNAKDYIVLHLTGKFCTDVSDANGMDCLDLKKLNWSEEILSASGISPDKLPQVLPSTALVGCVTGQAALETGLSENTRVVMGAGDGVAANVGAGSVAPGKVYCCLGTSAWVAGTSEKPLFDPERRVVCWAHAVPGMYSPNATMQYAGGCYSWLKSTVCTAEILEAEKKGISPYELMNDEILAAEPGAGGLVFLPHLMGERAPRWNNDAKGVLFGLRGDTVRGQILRSVVEGVCVNLGLCFDILKEELHPDYLTLIGGAARSAVWRDTLADVTGVTVQVPDMLEEANSLGAAVIAGVGCGLYKGFDAVEKFMKINNRVESRKEYAQVYLELKQKTNRLYEALAPLF